MKRYTYSLNEIHSYIADISKVEALYRASQGAKREQYAADLDVMQSVLEQMNIKVLKHGATPVYGRLGRIFNWLFSTRRK